MEVVGRKPVLVRAREPACGGVGQGTDASGALEDDVDHLGRHPEVGKDQRRHACPDGLQRCRRGDRDESAGGLQRVGHRTSGEPDAAVFDPALLDQVGHQLRIWPGLPVRLLLAVCGPQLHHGRPSSSQADQDRLPVGAVGWHLGLCREYQVCPWSPVAILPLGSRPEERQRCEPDSQVGGDRAAESGELGSLPMAVQDEEVATAAQRDGACGRGHADAR
jgi:hypothetical protein